jgi:hypothetical protein
MVAEGTGPAVLHAKLNLRSCLPWFIIASHSSRVFHRLALRMVKDGDTGWSKGD